MQHTRVMTHEGRRFRHVYFNGGAWEVRVGNDYIGRYSCQSDAVAVIVRPTEHCQDRTPERQAWTSIRCLVHRSCVRTVVSGLALRGAHFARLTRRTRICRTTARPRLRQRQSRNQLQSGGS